MILESETSKCPEYEVNPKIGNVFVNEKILEEYSVKIYEIDLFYEDYKKKKKTQKKEQKKYKMIKMGMIICYSEVMFIFLNNAQLQKLMKKRHVDRAHTFEEKRQESPEKKPGRRFFGTNTSKKGNENYKISRI